MWPLLTLISEVAESKCAQAEEKLIRTCNIMLHHVGCKYNVIKTLEHADIVVVYIAEVLSELQAAVLAVLAQLHYKGLLA